MQDVWLLKLASAAAAVDPVLHALRGASTELRSWQAVDDALTYVYLPGHLTPTGEGAGLGLEWHRLACVQQIDGVSSGHPAPFHYVVETDVLPAREGEFNAWYTEEHMPGLAAVPGTVRAARYVDTTGSPRYYACYDLVSPDTLGSPPWLAVRATAWSSIVRPFFRNTRRQMFRQTPA